MAKGFVRFNVKGGEKLEKRLMKMDRRMAGRALKQGMKTAMEPVKQLAIARAPVDTGRMKKSIRIAVFSKRNFAGAKVQTGTRKQLKIAPDAKHYYPAYVEYGYRKRNARPFLRSAFFDRKQVVLDRVVDDITKELEKP